MSSLLAQSENHRTGVPQRRLSAVPSQKLSLVMFMVPLAFLIILIISFWSWIRPRKMILSFAMDLR